MWMTYIEVPQFYTLTVLAMFYSSLLFFSFAFAALAHVFIELPLAKLWSITLRKIQYVKVTPENKADDTAHVTEKEVEDKNSKLSETSL